MNPERRKEIAYDLALECAKQRNIFKGSEPSTTEHLRVFDKIYKEIYDALPNTDAIGKLF